MLRQKIFNYTLLLLFVIISTFILFTDVYLNAFQGILRTTLNVDNLEYSDIDGNLIRGFEINNITISGSDYTLKSKKINTAVTFFDIFSGFSQINYIRLEGGELWLTNISDYLYNESDYSASVDNIELVEFDIIADSSKISSKQANISFNSGRIHNITGDASLFLSSGYIFDINKISINSKEEQYRYSFFIDSLNFENASFSNISISGDFHSLDSIITEFDISNIAILNEKFSGISGSLKCLDDKISLQIPADFNSIEESLIGGNVEVKDNVLNIFNAVLKIQDEDPISMQNQQLFINGGLSGKNISMQYRKGSLLVKDFSIKNFSNYYFYLVFKDFDISLFRGLKSKGYLSGDLYISDNEWRAGANTKIKNFSYDDYKIDEIRAERSFQDDDFTFSDLRFSKKKIGFLDISSFYNEIIHKIIERKKIEF